MQLWREGKNKENDNWLMPYCLDQWKSWGKKRKAFGKHFRLMEIYCGNDDMSVAMRAFMRWRRNVRKMMEKLRAMTQ
jgi:hypothetical protein